MDNVENFLFDHVILESIWVGNIEVILFQLLFDRLGILILLIGGRWDDQMDAFAVHSSSLQEVDHRNRVQRTTIYGNTFWLLLTGQEIHVRESFPSHFEVLVQVRVIDRVNSVDRLLLGVTFVVGGLVDAIGNQIPGL